MSASELNRLMVDLDSNPGLMAETEGLSEVQAWYDWAQGKGFNISMAEAGELADTYGAIDDKDLEQAAGGWNQGGP